MMYSLLVHTEPGQNHQEQVDFMEGMALLNAPMMYELIALNAGIAREVLQQMVEDRIVRIEVRVSCANFIFMVYAVDLIPIP